MKDILGENVIGWGSHFFCKMPHDGKKVAWHQDASYWPLTPTKTCTVWLAIDDTDAEPLQECSVPAGKSMRRAVIGCLVRWQY